MDIITKKKKLRIWFKSFERVCDVLKYCGGLGSAEVALELIQCSIVVEYDEQ